MPRSTTITIQSGDGPPSRSNSFNSEEESSHQDSHGDYLGADDWLDDDDDDIYDQDLHPSDSASASNEGHPLRSRSQRPGRRIHHTLQQQPHYNPVQTHAPVAPSSVDHSDEYGQHGRGYQPHPGGGRYYAPRGHAPGYPQNHVAPYMGGYPNGNQMVPFGNYNGNPFSPMSNGSSGTSYFGGEPRHAYDMAPYQPGYYPPPHGHYNLPAHMQQFHLTPHPPPTEVPNQSTTPAPKEPPAPDPEKIRLEAEIATLKAVEEKARAAEKQREVEAQIRKDAEEAFQRRMEDMRKAQEEAKKEIERAKADAERAARERMLAERKAEEDRAKQHAEAMKRAEENARMKFEAEMKAAEEKRKREEADRVRAEEAARIRLEAALKAEAAAKAAADKRLAEEAERLKQIQEDAKRKAEAESLAKVEAEKEAAKKAAEAQEAAKKEAEALKKKIEEEAHAKFEEAAKSKADKAPIKFKDAVGRKFSFPFHLCATWQGMEELIKQAFLQVDVLGPHVQEGHYDLIGPNGEIILPSVWEKVIEPDWAITMTMWPMEKSPPVGPRLPGMPGMPPGGRHGGIPMPPPNMGRTRPMPGMPQGRRPPGMGPGVAPPGAWAPGQGDPRRRSSHLPGGPNIINVEPPKSSKPKKNSAMLGFLAGKQTKKKSSKK